MMCFAQPSLSEQRSLAEGERELLNLLRTASPEVRETIQEYLDGVPLNGDWGLYKKGCVHAEKVGTRRRLHGWH